MKLESSDLKLSLYTYKAVVVSIYDADTIRANVDLGFGLSRSNISIRLARINAPEVRGVQRPQGIAARDFLRELLLGKDFILKTYKDRTGKYGRLVGEIYLNDRNINDLLVENNHAIYKAY